jgi:hypothetical protein
LYKECHHGRWTHEDKWKQSNKLEIAARYREVGRAGLGPVPLGQYLIPKDSEMKDFVQKQKANRAKFPVAQRNGGMARPHAAGYVAFFGLPNDPKRSGT